MFELAGANDMIKPDAAKLQHFLDLHKVDVNVVIGRTALGCASYKGHVEIVELLLRRGADVNKYSNNPLESALWWAASQGRVSVVRALIAGGAKVNEITGYNEGYPTALHVAARHGRAPVVHVLLNAGADSSVVNKAGKTAADLAVEHQHIDVVDAFKLASMVQKGAAFARCCRRFTAVFEQCLLLVTLGSLRRST